MNWLDKYSDDVSKAQRGKKVKPIYVESKNDPRYRAYQDSLSLYNTYENSRKIITSGGKYYPKPEITKPAKFNKTETFNITNPNNPLVIKKVGDDFSYAKIGDKGNPKITVKTNKKIQPIQSETFTRKESKFKSSKEYDAAAKKMRDFSDVKGKINWVGYEIQKYKKPQQEIIVKNQQPLIIQPDLTRVEALNIQPIEQTPINFPIQQIDTTPRFIEPKAFNISSQRTNMQGDNSYYDYTQEGATYEEVIKAQEAAKAYNADIERRYGNEEALKNPKAVERLKQLKQTVNVTPVYRNGGEFLGTTDEGFDYNGAWGGQFQMGGNVYPVNYVPMAQKGKKVLKKTVTESTSTSKDRIPISSKDIIKTLPGTNVHVNNKGEVVIKDEKGVYKPYNSQQQPEIVQGGKPKSGTQIVIENKQKQAETKKKILKPLDVTTDVMQLGNFGPHPVAQTIGKIGNVVGSMLDAYQAYDAFSEGDYVSGGINTASVLLPFGLGSQTFRRNSKYLQPGQPLYPFSPQANLPTNASLSMRMNFPRVDYIEPFTKVQGMTDKSLLANRALLGTLGAETVYDTELIPEFAMGGSIPGSVGFTYTRTNSPAPSNGKYTKKTMASAQDGNVIKDDLGQWAHPGEITEINSNDITMQGVPYPVLGISDTGDTKLMQPGKDYKFKGKKVIEYPLAKDGKELVKLNQLTNFTNYNTKQPGGWLDQY